VRNQIVLSTGAIVRQQVAHTVDNNSKLVVTVDFVHLSNVFAVLGASTAQLTQFLFPPVARFLCFRAILDFPQTIGDSHAPIRLPN
jgi:hypothetical protein